MLGSGQSISGPNIALNTIMAQELKEFADKLEKSKNFQSDLQKLIKKTFTDHQRIIFNGNGYDESWIKEAKKRGLANLVSTADALPEYVSKKNIDLYVKNNVYTEEEVRARGAIHVETYNATIEIEARTMIDMIHRQILPAASAYTAELCQRAAALKAAGVVVEYEKNTATNTAILTDTLAAACSKLEADFAKVPADPDKAMKYLHKTIIKDMDDARSASDALEAVVDEQYWPFPVYADLLFSE
jgi:glutamine synthetase